jgi:hypothetical protein
MKRAMQALLHSRWIVVGCLAALPLLSPRPAEAIVVNVAGQSYDVSVITTSPNQAPSIFAPIALNGSGKMPWWGNPNLAAAFAMEVFSGLGPGADANYGPIFAYEFTVNGVAGVAQSLTDINDQTVVDPAPSRSDLLPYAIARQPVAVPLPPPFLGIGAGFCYARRLRRLRHLSCAKPALP